LFLSSDAVEDETGNAQALALKTDGSVVAWVRNIFNQTSVPASATNAIAISAGGNQSLALKKDGVVEWGQTNAALPDSLTNVIAPRGRRHLRNTGLPVPL